MSESTMTVQKDGTKLWQNSAGKLHREDGPAVEWSDGSKEWHQNGRCHRIGGSAIESACGAKHWYQNDMRHREDGPAIEWADGSTAWYKKGKLHRKDGPAIEDAFGSKQWWQSGKLHRLDGPAYEYYESYKDSKWYYKGKHLGEGITGFWALWDFLNEKQRENVNLHTWLTRLTNA